METKKNESENRYEAYVDGELAGAAYYELDDKRIVFTHTEVDDRFEGMVQGGLGDGTQQHRADRDPELGAGEQ